MSTNIEALYAAGIATGRVGQLPTSMDGRVPFPALDPTSARGNSNSYAPTNSPQPVRSAPTSASLNALLGLTPPPATPTPASPHAPTSAPTQPTVPKAPVASLGKGAIGIAADAVGGRIGEAAGRKLGGDLGAGYGEALGTGLATAGGVGLATGNPLAAGVAGGVTGVASLVNSALGALGSAISAGKGLERAQANLAKSNERYENALKNRAKGINPDNLRNASPDNIGGKDPLVGYNVSLNGTINYADNGAVLFTYSGQVVASISAPLRYLEKRVDSNSAYIDIGDAGPDRSILLASTGGNLRALINNVSINLIRADGSPQRPSDYAPSPRESPPNPQTRPADPSSGSPQWLPSVDLRGSDADRKAFPDFAEPTSPENPFLPARPNSQPAPLAPSAPQNNKAPQTGSAGSSTGSASSDSSSTGSAPSYSSPSYSTPTGSPSSESVESGEASPPFQAKPFESGKSNPSEQFDPVDVNTGLTRSEFEKAKEADTAKRRAQQLAPQVAAANSDAKKIEEQLKNLSTVPRQDLGGKSPQEFQREQYQNSIKNDEIRLAAYKQASSASQTTPQSTTNTSPNAGQVIGGLAGIAATVAALKLGSDLLVNNSISNTPKIDNINTNTQPNAQQTNAKQGVCDAMQPTQCGFEGVKAATTEATNPIKDIANDNKGLLAGIGATLANMIATLATILTKFTQLFTFLDINAKVEAVKSTMTLALTVHNALMLSQSLGDTLGLIIDNVLNVFGNTFRSTDGTQISASQYLGATVRQWIINVIGADNYLKLSDALATANRIYQTGMNIVSTVQSILDSAASVAQATGINVAKIGNALRDESVVSPRAYTHMDDTALGNRPTTLSRFTALTTTISDLDTKAQNLVTITAAPIQIKDAIKQSKDDIKAFNDARDGNSVEAKAARDAKVEEIKALKPLTEATVGKRDDDT